MNENGKIAEIVQNTYFRKALTILGVIFITSTYFISIKPDAFTSLGYVGIFTYNVVASGLVLMPLLTPKFNFVLLVVISALGNMVNTSVNYAVGYTSNSLFSGNKIIKTFKKFIEKFGLFAVFVLSIVPLPLDVNGLLSGYLGIPYKKYIAVNFLGKVVAFTLVGLGIFTVAKITD